MKKMVALFLAGLLAAAWLGGCAGGAGASPESAAAPQAGAEALSFRIAGLKGATTMGMVKLMADAEAGKTAQDYRVEMFGTADEIVPKLVGGELDMAALPANLASVLYSSTGGGVAVAAVNTLGLLYVVETGDSIRSVEDLRGRTLYSTGKGTTPEFALNYVLRQNGLNPAEDLSIEFKSESTEIAAIFQGTENAIAVLPQPYVTAVQMQNDKLRVALSLSDEWDKVGGGSGLVTGVLLVRRDFLANEANARAFYEDFLPAYRDSIEWVNANTAEAAGLVARYGIVEKAAVAEKALPACNIVYLDGEEMKARLSGYLEVLYAQLPESVGGALPGDDFYLSS